MSTDVENITKEEMDSLYDAYHPKGFVNADGAPNSSDRLILKILAFEDVQYDTIFTLVAAGYRPSL
jgi:hypothetical protein